jgi:hypothetical protein
MTLPAFQGGAFQRPPGFQVAGGVIVTAINQGLLLHPPTRAMKPVPRSPGSREIGRDEVAAAVAEFASSKVQAADEEWFMMAILLLEDG